MTEFVSTGGTAEQFFAAAVVGWAERPAVEEVH